MIPLPQPTKPASLRSLLLRRRGVVAIDAAGPAAGPGQAQAVALELAGLGWVPSTRLQARLERCSGQALADLLGWVLPDLADLVGGGQVHTPLFRSFPHGVPRDTASLWWSKVLVHFAQAEGQPCLSCGGIGTTHVLSPCRHVVCGRCFDGSSYSACPVCEHHVDRTSPFFKPPPERPAAGPPVRFRRLDLCTDPAAEATGMFRSLCARTQPPTPDDRQALVSLVHGLGPSVADAIPGTIPVRETAAAVFGTLLALDPEGILELARRHIASATDVLRLIAVHSGADPALMPQPVLVRDADPGRFRGPDAATYLTDRRSNRGPVPLRMHRFHVARMPRRLRRALLGLLDAMPAERLHEDMLRHRAWWVWLGEFLHPHEYAGRFPNAARGFLLVRGTAPDGTPAPAFRSWASRIEALTAAGDTPAVVAMLRERPGEFARRLDHLLRISGRGPQGLDLLVDGFIDRIGRCATPVLATLRNHLARRGRAAALRVYWPKVAVGRGVFAPDVRPPLPPAAAGRAVAAIEAELLRRFAALPAFDRAVVDLGLDGIVMPFNARTASPSAVDLPRGSTVPVGMGRVMRLFLHWCQPESGGTTDLDLSVAFYDRDWRHVGVCSYYQLTATARDGQVFARSAGDLRDAPWPDGASEFVDIHADVARRSAGARYAVAVINNFSGMPFARLERAFAGLMVRDGDGDGGIFDPRTVALRFALQGENGVFMPLVLDLAEGRLHWLDVYARGGLDANTAATSARAITTICPGLIAYFTSGVRPSVLDIGLLHAAARCREVVLRGPGTRTLVRRSGEDAAAFLRRLTGDGPGDAAGPVGRPTLALLVHGDLELPEGSSAYALFPGCTRTDLAAADLLA